MTANLPGVTTRKSQMTREGCCYLVNEGYQVPLRVVSVKTRYWNCGYERITDVKYSYSNVCIRRTSPLSECHKAGKLNDPKWLRHHFMKQECFTGYLGQEQHRCGCLVFAEGRQNSHQQPWLCKVAAMIIVSDNLTDNPASAVLYRGIIKFFLDERRYFIILVRRILIAVLP